MFAFTLLENSAWRLQAEAIDARCAWHPVDAPQPRARRAAAGTTIKRKLSGAGAAMPKQRVGLRRELAGAPRTREGFSRTFLLRFICEKHTLSFRYAELDALLAAHGVDPKAAYAPPAGAGADPYVAVAFPSAACCAEVVSKAILVRDALEVWGEGHDHAACAAAVAAAPAEGAARGRTRERNSQLQRLLSRPFPTVSADIWTSDHLSERSRSVDAFSGTRARGTPTLKRR